MKSFFTLFLIASSFNLFAQQVIEVKSKVIDLGVIRETLGTSTKKIILKVTSDSPEEFKVKFDYNYRFHSQKLSGAFIAPNGNLSFTTQTVSSDLYEGSNKLRFDISDSSVSRGDDLELVLEISKPNQNSHAVKVTVSLKDSKGNTVSGGRKLLGLLGRSYKVSAGGCEAVQN